MISPGQLRILIGVAVFAAALGWAYWPTFDIMADRWSNDPLYSHGFLVPAFAAYLLWHRRELAPSLEARASFAGIVLVGGSIAMHIAGAYFYYEPLSMMALLPLLAGACLCWGGWPTLRWAWPSIAFLGFMLPLPYRAEVALSQPLQRLATYSSTYLLQTIGFSAVSEGNVIIIEESRIDVVQACSGLGMLVTFAAMTTAVVLVVNRTLLEKLLVLPSAILIAVIANVLRISVTGMLHVLVGKQAADMVFHDLAGWLMMPVALGMLWIELRLLSWLLLDPEPDGVPVLGLGVPTTPAPSAARADVARTETVGTAEAKLV